MGDSDAFTDTEDEQGKDTDCDETEGIHSHINDIAQDPEPEEYAASERSTTTQRRERSDDDVQRTRKVKRTRVTHNEDNELLEEGTAGEGASSPLSNEGEKRNAQKTKQKTLLRKTGLRGVSI